MTEIEATGVAEADTNQDGAGDDSPDDGGFGTIAEPSKRVRIAATAIVIVPFVTAVLRALRSDWFPVGDNALLFIRAPRRPDRGPPVSRLVDVGVVERG